jgi:LPXTG-motif cell wall-anchored protein
VNEPPARDFFDKARAWAVALMLAAGLACIVGSLLDWVTITARPELQEGAAFPGADNQPEAPRVTRPFTGIEAGDGWWSLAGGVVLVAAAALVYVRRRAGWGWLGVLAAVVIGAVTIADYRGIGDLSSSISHRMNIVGGAEPAIGLTLAVAGAIAGVIGSVAAIAASPRPEVLRTSA